jgi:hypothetical protein
VPEQELRGSPLGFGRSCAVADLLSPRQPWRRCCARCRARQPWPRKSPPSEAPPSTSSSWRTTSTTSSSPPPCRSARSSPSNSSTPASPGLSPRSSSPGFGMHSLLESSLFHFHFPLFSLSGVSANSLFLSRDFLRSFSRD